jgi:FkbM family methyltransferase
MTNETGIGHSYRDPSWIERLAARCRAVLSGSALHKPLKKALESTLEQMPGDHLVSTLPGGERIRLDPAHRQLGWNDLEYEAFKAAVRPGAIVLDVGANLGAYTVLFAQWVGTTGRVYAFEPAPASRAALERQIALNEVGSRVLVRPEAVSASSGARRFRADGLQGDNRLISPAATSVDRAIDVSVTSLDDFCERESVVPDVIKIDVEGAELEALRGARRTIARAGGAAHIFVELHPSLWSQMGVTRGDIEVELRTQGLVLERIDGEGDPWTIEGVCLRVRPKRATTPAGH